MSRHMNYGYYVVSTNHLLPAERDKPYAVVTEKMYFRMATEYNPIYTTSRKQEAIELCNAFNKEPYLKSCDWVKTKHYVFRQNNCGWVRDTSAHMVSSDISKTEAKMDALLEIVHRKNEEIKSLNRELELKDFDYKRYKYIAEKLYDKLHNVSDSTKYFQMLEDIGVSHKDLCDLIHEA